MPATGSGQLGKRGLHLNGWPISYPYTFRGWAEHEWREYLNLLADSGLNLFLLWPFMEIMPVPLSGADQEYLAECRRVVDYAQGRGLEVWIMQSPNRVAVSDAGVLDPRQRPYWLPEVQVDQDPAVPEQRARLLAAREALYRHLGNATGYLTIDCDPGGWPDSPVSEFVGIFQESRDLLDRLTERGPQTKQICWLWMDWQRRMDPGTIRAQVQGLQEGLREPWGLIAGREEWLPLCRELGVLEKTVYLPYNLLEPEPSLPFTGVRFAEIAAALSVAQDYPELAGVMANVQCPLLQLPHTGQYLRWTQGRPAAAADAPEMLAELASRVFPESAALLAEGWAALAGGAPGDLDRLAEALESAAARGELGPPGEWGRHLFPRPALVVEDLALQLRLRAREGDLLAALQAGADLAEALEQYLGGALVWAQRHGFSRLTSIGVWCGGLLPYGPGLTAVVAALRERLGTETGPVRAFLAPIAERLQTIWGRQLVTQSCVEPLARMLTEPRP